MKNMDEQWKKRLAGLGIEPNLVIDGTVESKASYMWRTPDSWPLGGTYEANIPLSSSDRMVGQKITETITIVIIGAHPEATETLYSPEGTRSTVVMVEEGDWVFSE